MRDSGFLSKYLGALIFDSHLKGSGVEEALDKTHHSFSQTAIDELPSHSENPRPVIRLSEVDGRDFNMLALGCGMYDRFFHGPEVCAGFSVGPEDVLSVVDQPSIL